MRITYLFSLTFVLALTLNTLQLAGQSRLVVPVEMSFVNESDFNNIGLKVLTGGADMEKIVMGDAQEREQRIAGFRKLLAEVVGDDHKEYRVIDFEDLPADIAAKWREVSYTAYGISPGKALIGNKKYEDAIGEVMAPVVNQLCDDFNAEEVLFVYIQLTNTRKNYKKKGKPPVGSIGVTATLIDGDSGLALEKKTKMKSGNNEFSEEAVEKLMVAALKKFLGK